jgi:hypothetical protein
VVIRRLSPGVRVPSWMLFLSLCLVFQPWLGSLGPEIRNNTSLETAAGSQYACFETPEGTSQAKDHDRSSPGSRIKPVQR